MDIIEIQGEVPLHGRIHIHGSKNAALPILAATVLIPGITVLHNCPRITDVFHTIEILEELGCRIRWEENNTLIIDALPLKINRIDSTAATMMRSSVTFLGALLARTKAANIPEPGGCVIGKRPIDLHQMSLEKLGASFQIDGGRLLCNAKSLHGTQITLPFPSVGATENILLAASGITEEVVIRNAAREPEVCALCSFLQKAGIRIRGAGTENIRIRGMKRNSFVEFQIPPDRIVAGTYAIATAGVGGSIYMENAPVDELRSVWLVLKEMGVSLLQRKHGIVVSRKDRLKGIPYLATEVYPGFPTDLQSQLIAALCAAETDSVIEENIFDGRFGVTDEMNRLNAAIHVEERRAYVTGQRKLKGNICTARELRGGAALVITGLMAEGITSIEKSFYIDRGYEDICRDLKLLGAKIKRRKDKV